MKRIAQALVLIFLSAAAASPLWAQGNYTAASCNYSDVNTLINGPTHVAIDGDTITVPAGTCTWQSTLSVTKGITIVGAGSGSTVIQDYINQSNMFRISLSSAGETFRLSSMSLQPSPNLGSSMAIGPGNGAIATIAGSCSSSTCSQIRFDNLSISGWLYGTGSSQNFGGFLMTVDSVFGVLDHLNVAFTTGGEFIDVGHGTYGGTGSNGDNSWAQPDSFGSGNALYIESSTFTDVPSAGMAITDSDFGGGGRYVVRFNNLTNASIQTHGTESTGRERGVRQVEVYNNNLTCTNNTSGCDFVGLRSGTIHFFDNTVNLSNGAWSNNGVSLSNYRNSTVFQPWGVCAGQGQYDQNDGNVYASGTLSSVSGGPPLVATDTSKSWSANQWVQNGSPYSLMDTTTGTGCEITSSTSNTVTCDDGFWSGPPHMNAGDSYQILRATVCLDQTGRGRGTTYLSGNPPSPTGWSNQALDPAYVWGNGGSAPNFGWIGARTARVIANRDYYNQTSGFNGSSGTGTGTLAARPSSCTTGVAYWATDQGSWNSSGNGGQGQLYICTSTNTWTLSYTPYSYPHPLTLGQGGGSPPAPPTNLVATPQ